MTGERDSKHDTNAPERCPLIVGIGASAGGQEALEQLFATMPADCGLTFVVVMHLPPAGPSFLADMLGRLTPMAVVTAKEGMELAPDTVYVIPAGWELTVSGGLLHLEEPAARGARHPIDRLFSSLAVELKKRAIAVVLSGSGMDGAEGVKQIRSVGGTVIVQEPGSAAYPAMPRSAVAAGADFVLPAAEIPAKIAEITSDRCPLLSGECRVASHDEELAAVFAIVKAQTGHDFASYKANTVLRRIERRMAVNDVTGLQKYVAILKENSQEAHALAQDILIGVTAFFRDPEAFETLRRDVIPRLFAERRPDEPVRIWHACCATGEEVYSMAFLIREHLDRERIDATVQLFATDIDEAAIAQARAGLYPDDIEAEVGEERLKTFFIRSNNRWQVVKRVREMVVFAHHSLIKNPPFSRLDLLVCRNFLIYLNPDMQKRLIALFHQVLKPGGYLFLGSSETVGRHSDLFTPLDKKWKIFQRLESGRRAEALFPFTTPARYYPGTGRTLRPAEAFDSFPGAVAEKLLIERYSPPCVVVNEKYEVVYVSGRTGRFLEVPEGEPTRDILRMAREELRPALRAAIYKAFGEQKGVVFRGVKVAVAGEEASVNVLVEPVAAPPPAERLAMVVFEPALPPAVHPAPGGAGEAPAGDETARDALVRQLEEQLRITHEQLQAVTDQLETSNEGFLSANEELISMNEEFQSANEELQSTNEELETSKEELQALNEELVTVNAELQGKVEELDRTTSDLENLLTSSEIATIFLDRQLTIKRFSPAMADIFNLISADIGRPFRHLAGTIDWSGLHRDAEEVLENLAPVEREVTGVENRRHYLMRVLPYRTAEEKIDGIVVTLIDITEHKRMDEQIRHLASFPQLNPNPILELESTGRIIFCNPATRKTLESLGLGEAESGVFLPADMDEILKSWDRQSETTLYRDISVRHRNFGATIFLTPQFDAVRIYAFDITKRKRAEEAILRAKDEWERTFDSVPDLIAIMDSEHRIVRANRAMAQRLGKQPEECVGLPCYAAIHGTEAPPASCPHTMTLADRREHEAEVHEDALGGDFLVSTTPLLDREGKLTGSVHVARDITDRKRAEDALRESEERVRHKLDSILSPEGGLGDLDLADIIDAPSLQSLVDNFYELTRMPMGLIDLKGKVLVGVGWQDICTKFHRVHPETCGNCVESDVHLSAGVSQGEYKIYKCKNNMWDVATPVIVGDRHFGNLFMGQFFFEDEPLDYGFFRSQARKYGFDEEEYIAALEAAPRLSRETLNTSMAFFMKLAEVLSKLGYSNLKLARSLSERDSLMDTLRASEEQFRRAIEDAPIPIIMHTDDGEVLQVSRTWSELTGYSISDMTTLDAWLNKAYGEGAEAVRNHVRELFKGNPHTIGTEFPILTRDGQTRYWSFNASSPGKLQDGRRFVVVMALDITERKRAEDEMRLSEERYRTLFNTLLEGFCIIEVLFDADDRPVDYRFLECNPAFEAQTGLRYAQGKRMRELAPEHEAHWFEIYGKVALTGEPARFVNEARALNRWYEVSAYRIGEQDSRKVAILFNDITEHKRAELEREATIEFLRLVNESTATRDLIEAAVGFFQQQSGCEALGIRLREGDDYPYYEVRGFPGEFVVLENELCSRDAAGNIIRDCAGSPVIDCMCGNIICGRFDPSKPFFTAKGSFWSNGTTELLASTSDEDRQARTRNRCNGEGYESVALIPLRLGEERLGLLQLNDRRTGMFTPELIALWERLAGYLAVALAKFRTEEALRESKRQNEFLANILEAASQPFAVGYPDGRLDLANTAYEQLTGYSGDELRAINWSATLTPPEWREIERERLEELRSAGQPVRYEKEYIRKDGSRVPVELLVHLATDMEGKPAYYYAFVTDITERKRAEEMMRTRLRLSELARHGSMEELIQTALDDMEHFTGSSIGFFHFVNEDQETLSLQAWSTNTLRNMCQAEGQGLHYPISQAGVWVDCFYTRAPLIHNDYAALPDRKGLPEGHAPVVRELTVPVLRGNFVVAIIGVGNKATDYTQVDVDVLQEFSSLLMDLVASKRAEEGLRRAHDELEQRVEDRTIELASAMNTLHEETVERIRAMEELRAKEQLLMQQSRLAAMGEMIGNIAHQWRQPLNMLGLIIQELPMAHEPGSPGKREIDAGVTKAMRVISHMSQTIDDFRDFFRPDKEKATFKVNDVVTRTVALIEGSFRDQQIEIDIRANDSVFIHGYPNEYSQVVLNVLVNARDAFVERATASPRVVRIRLFRENGKGVLTIGDNAGGIGGDILDKIFDPYFTTKGPDKGTGVGLFMAKVIIEKNMEGKLSAANSGNGAEFRIEV